ncbi:MAG: hypothetical protein K2L22_06055 [Muribaculaceae bacterium]|nr:hypothetical protein [Muribaculaceae bacterium]
MKDGKETLQEAGVPAKLEAKRKYVEIASAIGLLLVLFAMMAPFFEGLIGRSMMWAKWVYASGALVYTCARVVDVNAPGDSLRLRRLRRLEFWAGVCFIVGAAFWFYKLQYFSGLFAGPLAVMRQTVAFTMAGAVIQIVASWMIAFRMKKEYNAR